MLPDMGCIENITFTDASLLLFLLKYLHACIFHHDSRTVRRRGSGPGNGYREKTKKLKGAKVRQSRLVYV
jgi:hypothetical protein